MIVEMFHGCTSRLGYLMKGIIIPFCLTGILFVLTLYATTIFVTDDGGIDGGELTLVIVLSISTLFIPFMMMVLATVKRLRDMGVTPWLIFASLIPFVDFIILLCCLIIPGKTRETKNAEA